MDDNPNAFINEKQILFITTGLIKYCPSNNALIGVLAHELGHLESYHIAKKIESVKILGSLKKLGNLSIIASSLATNNPYLINSLLVNEIGVQNYYSSFSREQEREADIYSVKTLNKLNLPSDPLLNFLKILKKRSEQKGLTPENFKFLSHPVYKERFEIINNLKNNEYINNNENLSNQFKFVQAKLFGHTEEKETGLKTHLKSDYYSYANSIILSRSGKLKKALIIINNLINKYPLNYFLLETKADILVNHGYTLEAKKFYELVFEKQNNNFYIKKRIFEIEYDNNFNELKNKSNFFKNYSILLRIFPNDKILYEKFEKIAFIKKSDDWMYFFKINKYNSNDEKKSKFNSYKKILDETNDANLIKLIKYKMDKIKNE